MTEEELQKLYESCLDEERQLDWNKYDAGIKASGGVWFSYCNQDRQEIYRQEGALQVVEYMEEQGFIVFEDPYCEDCDVTGWVVFPPEWE